MIKNIWRWLIMLATIFGIGWGFGNNSKVGWAVWLVSCFSLGWNWRITDND